MATHYNFYQTLQLNEDSSTPELQEELHARLQRMQEDNVPFGSPQYQELQTALTILGDQQRRQKYDARLHDEKAETIDINALRCLAQTGSFPDQFPTAQQPAEGTVGASPRPHHEDAADQGKNTQGFPLNDSSAPHDSGKHHALPEDLNESSPGSPSAPLQGSPAFPDNSQTNPSHNFSAPGMANGQYPGTPQPSFPPAHGVQGGGSVPHNQFANQDFYAPTTAQSQHQFPSNSSEKPALPFFPETKTMPKPAKNLIWLLTGLSGLGLLVMVFCILSGMEYLFFSLAPLFAVVHAVIPAISLFFLGSQRSPGSPIIVAFLQFTMLLFVFGAAMEGFSELYFPFASGLGVILMVLYLLGCLVAMILALLTSTRQWYAGVDAPSSGQAGQQTSHDQGFYTDFPQNNGLGGAQPLGGTGNAGNAGNVGNAADQGFKANPNSAPGSAPGNPTNNSF